MTRSHHPRPGRRHVAPLWLAAPLLAVLATMLIVFMLPRQPEAQEALRAATPPAPYRSSDPSLPSGGSYTTTSEPQAHVEAF